MSTQQKLFCLSAIDLVKWWSLREQQSYFPADPDEWPEIIRAYIRDKVGIEVDDEVVSTLIQQLYAHASHYIGWAQQNHTIH